MKSNQKIFITGSSSGIGEAIAYEYASQGQSLVSLQDDQKNLRRSKPNVWN